MRFWKLFFLFFLHLCSLPAAEVTRLPWEGHWDVKEGIYDVADWKRDWPGCAFEDGVKEGHVEWKLRAGVAWLKVKYQPGQIGPEKGGAGWRWPFRPEEGVEMRYTLRFSEDFDFVKGGKLPGLCGGPDNVSGGRPADGSNGFSVRLMWRRDGRGEAYVYHMNQPDKYGESFAFPEDFRFTPGKPVKIRLAVWMNAASKRDGGFCVWAQRPDEEEKLLVERKDMAWRAQDTFRVDSLYFETFHGGSDASWAPKKACFCEFSAFSLLPFGK